MNSELADLLPQFKYVRTLSSDPITKTVGILGTIEGENAILKLEQSSFQIDETFDISKLIKKGNVKQLLHNDIYYTGLSILEYNLTDSPGCQVSLIWPATELHIKKADASQQNNSHMVTETPETYLKIVKPYIDELHESGRLQWVKNILFHGTEAERVVYRDDDIVVLPDMKWDGVDMESFYLVGIVCRDDIRSIRDLNSTHIPWLKSIRDNILGSLVNKYDNSKIDRSQLRLFVHYQPSYYHFHIHIVNVKYCGLGHGITAGKAILVDDILDMLEILGEEGYMKKNLNYVLNENHDLWERGMKNHTI